MASRKLKSVALVILLLNSSLYGSRTYKVTYGRYLDSLPAYYRIGIYGAHTVTICGMLCSNRPSCVSAAHSNELSKCYLFSSLDELDKAETSSSPMAVEAFRDNKKFSLLTPSQTYKDCHDAFIHGERESGKAFLLRPDYVWRVIKAVCHFDGTSGWTVVQRRLDGSVNFFRNWTDYAGGFGNYDGEYWLGLESIYYLTKTNRRASILLEAHDGETRVANYSTFYVGDSGTDYTLSVSGYSGTAGDSLTWHSGMKFATFDRDVYALSIGYCAQTFKGAWWYNTCHASNLNGLWVANGEPLPFGTGVVWSAFKPHTYSLKRVHIRVGK